MNITQLKKQIESPHLITKDSVKMIEDLLEIYPYFNTGHILLSKGLLNIKSIRYNSQIKKAACYCSDRKKLFNLINMQLSYRNQQGNNIEEKSNISKPLIFDKDELYSFSEWLSLSKAKTIKRDREEVITDFIKNPISINQPKKESFFKPSIAAKESLLENDEIVTPTLAKVYLEQKHYDKAISAYKKLCLKYPKKNSFFADQIKLIEKLKEE